MNQIIGLFCGLLLMGGAAFLFAGYMADAQVKEYELQRTQQELRETQIEFEGYQDGVKDSQ